MERKAIIPTEVMADILDIPVAQGFKPTEAEVRLLRVLLDPDIARRNPSITKLCELADVNSIQTYYTAIKKPGFLKTIQMYAVDPCKAKAHRYVQWLEDHAEKGSPWHMKALLAMTGLYQEGALVEVEQVKIITRPGRAVLDQEKEQG